MRNKKITYQNLEKIDTLLESIKGMSQDEYKKMLNSIVRFHQYSYLNSLILMFSGCSQVAGYKRWEELGRHVQKGARAVWILAPRFIKEKVTDEETGEETETPALKGFLSVPVFDIASTQGEEIKRNMTTQSPIDFSKVKDFASKEGFIVRFKALEIKRGGYIADKIITLNKNLSGPEHIGTFIHELAHGLLGHNQANHGLSTELREQQAETVTYLVCKNLGIERKSEFYLKSWKLSENIKKDFAKIDGIAKKIIKGLTGEKGEQDQ